VQLVRDANSDSISDQFILNPHFNKIPRQRICTVKFRKNRSAPHVSYFQMLCTQHTILTQEEKAAIEIAKGPAQVKKSIPDK
jgi:hypothetical protein